MFTSRTSQKTVKGPGPVVNQMRRTKQRLDSFLPIPMVIEKPINPLPMRPGANEPRFTSQIKRDSLQTRV